MGNTRENRFTVHQRLAASESRLTALEAENKTLRQWVLGELTSKINDAKNTIQSSIRVPQDGRDGLPGRDGADGQSIVGPVGPAGDVLYIGPDELFVEVKKLRRAIVERHAAYIARIVHNIEVLGRPEHQSTSYRHFRSLLQDLLRDIEALR
jgi:hypothetical protein